MDRLLLRNATEVDSADFARWRSACENRAASQQTRSMAAGRHQPGPREQRANVRIGTDVLEALEQTGCANVMIALQRPAVARARGLDMAALRSRIGQMQREVMAGLPAGYQASHTYSALSALAGRVNSKAALAALARYPHVVRIERRPRSVNH